MRLTMSPATAEDVPGLAAILFEEYMEMHEWTRVRFSAVDPEDRHRYLAAGLREDLTSPKAPLVIQKMVDEDSGEIVAFLQLNERNVPPNPRGDVEPIVKPKGYNVPPMLDHYDKMVTAQKAAMKDIPFLR
ncbi:hypothetical protein ONZ43_g2020 [Nemania bipapillata]|uniref:Uncharacterized protein n=1 Tax=Nemania bipapillata TaxID=110536 RepID=A0ACC2J2D9_9PEZI|nr:hypothetical protein ONZ43_g2020 [Nemania bipapillata]